MGMLQIPLHSIDVRMECRIHVKYLIDDELEVSSSLLWARGSPRFPEEGNCSAGYGRPSFLVPGAPRKTFIPAPCPRPPSPQMPHDPPKMKVFPFEGRLPVLSLQDKVCIAYQTSLNPLTFPLWSLFARTEVPATKRARPADPEVPSPGHRLVAMAGCLSLDSLQTESVIGCEHK